MQKNLQYIYLGENGTVSTSVKLEGVYCVKKYTLIADDDKKLTKDNINFYDQVTVPTTEVDQWYEV